MDSRSHEQLLDAVAATLANEKCVVLAVSGGADSMALLDAADRLRPDGQRLVVATVDHGTGPAATEAAALVEREAKQRGLEVRLTRLRIQRGSEAAWREARWAFLRRVACEEGGRVATAHTLDDHVETVVMRILRGAGVRGIAGLLAPSDIARPFLFARREAVRQYVANRAVPYVEDPSNSSLAFFRNRVRLEILPAILAVRPAFWEEILDLSQRAARLRSAVDTLAQSLVFRREPDGAIAVPAESLAQCDEGGLRLLWQSLAAEIGVPLDRRAVVRLASFVRRARVGSVAQGASGIEAVRLRDAFLLRRGTASAPRDVAPLSASRLHFGRFVFDRIRDEADGMPDAWYARLPRTGRVVVRSWQPGDRLLAAPGRQRRVARYFGDAGIPGPLRKGWPVVQVDGAIVWIPGVRRSVLLDRLDGNGSYLYRCGRIPTS
jgi:tRNA(Ile)-lysidine synthase